MNDNLAPRSSLPLLLWLGYVFFVIYAALVPLQYHGIPLEQAWTAFQQIPFVKLDTDLRADLIANGVLYVPVAFLTAYLLTERLEKAPRWILLTTAGCFSMALAVAVEFSQIYFPPRTVKFNDILSESTGSVVGLALFTRYSSWFQLLLKSFLWDQRRLKLVLLEAYAVAYLAFALFPFDLLLSLSEVQAKIHSDRWGWFLASNSPRFTLIGFQLIAEVVLSVPFGILLVRVGGVRNASYKRALLMGMLFGTAIEIAQFFLYSGISQGLSVMSRTIGVCCGVACCKLNIQWSPRQLASVLRRYTLPIAVVYLVVLLDINRWFISNWHGMDFAAKQLDQVNFVPLYYQYYAGEAKALFSVLGVCLSYMPIAALVWAYRRSPGFAAVTALTLSTGVEASKLFMEPGHPDPSNVLLAGASSWLVLTLVDHLSLAQTRFAAIATESTASTKSPGLQSAKSASVPAWLIICLMAAGFWTFAFPAFRGLLLLVLIGCLAAVRYRPALVFAVIPAALPVFDLAPWSGRLFFDEFDVLLLVSMAVAYARVHRTPRTRFRSDSLLTSAVALVALSFAVSAARGMLPFQFPDANSFNNYFSPYNALRIVKGAVWALLMYRLARRFAVSGIDTRRPFCWGMTLGLALTVLAILWERIAFTGLWNFTEGYRVSGPFSAMHTGGAYIECFIAAATPFLLVLMLEKRNWPVRLAGLLLLLATTYAVMVTYSRNGYSAFVVGVCIMFLTSILKSKQLVRNSAVVMGLAGAMLLVAVPIFVDKFAQSRMATVSADLDVRQMHWADALDIRDAGWATTLFGMGIGRFPETNYWRGPADARTGTYQLEKEAGNTYLRLSSGRTLYLDQIVPLVPGQGYLLQLAVRPSRPDSTLDASVCEKWILTSYNCILVPMDLGREHGAWHKVQARFNLPAQFARPWYRIRPIKLSLYFTAPASTIDIDDVRLQTPRGINLLRNGNFTNGLDHWLFTSDSHLNWHLKSLAYGVLFDQGWFGLIALCLLIALALSRSIAKALRGDILAGASLAGLTSFLISGLFDTLIDDPRFLLLALLLVMLCTMKLIPGGKDASGNAVNDLRSPTGRDREHASSRIPDGSGARKWPK